jgi:hypothetical protein
MKARVQKNQAKEKWECLSQASRTLLQLQGYISYNKTQPPRTLQKAYA